MKQPEMSGWDLLTDQQHAAATAAAGLIGDADMRFVLMMWPADGRVGAVISNIEPANAVRLIEASLAAAKAHAEHEDIAADRLH